MVSCPWRHALYRLQPRMFSSAAYKGSGPDSALARTAASCALANMGQLMANGAESAGVGGKRPGMAVTLLLLSCQLHGLTALSAATHPVARQADVGFVHHALLALLYRPPVLLVVHRGNLELQLTLLLLQLPPLGGLLLWRQVLEVLHDDLKS